MVALNESFSDSFDATIKLSCSYSLSFIICCSGPIAHPVEHRADNAGVSGSSPLGPTMNESSLSL